MTLVPPGRACTCTIVHADGTVGVETLPGDALQAGLFRRVVSRAFDARAVAGDWQAGRVTDQTETYAYAPSFFDGQPVFLCIEPVRWRLEELYVRTDLAAATGAIMPLTISYNEAQRQMDQMVSASGWRDPRELTRGTQERRHAHVDVMERIYWRLYARKG